ncbi:MAG: alpha/beta fold hydrolase [Pirellulales bacterium]|nr:alpha/beta fold hydrolase [Pirellulales bacterium]
MNGIHWRTSANNKLLVALLATACLTAGGCAGPLGFLIASAPNRFNPLAGRKNPLPPMEKLLADRHLWVEVGPPEATLSVSVLEPRTGNPPKGTIIVLHGIAARSITMYPQAMELAKAGYRSVLVDLRGEGRSTGKFRTFGVHEARDISQVIDALDGKGLISGPVGVMGLSYGATTSIHLAAIDPRVRAVVAVEPFGLLRPEIPHFSRTMLPGIGWLIPDSLYQKSLDEAGKTAGFDPDNSDAAAAIGRTDAPVLLLHGTSDMIVPYWNSVVLSQAASENSVRIPIEGGGHLSLWADFDGTVSGCARVWFDHWLSRETASF